MGRRRRGLWKNADRVGIDRMSWGIWGGRRCDRGRLPVARGCPSSLSTLPVAGMAHAAPTASGAEGAPGLGPAVSDGSAYARKAAAKQPGEDGVAGGLRAAGKCHRPLRSDEPRHRAATCSRCSNICAFRVAPAGRGAPSGPGRAGRGGDGDPALRRVLNLKGQFYSLVLDGVFTRSPTTEVLAQVHHRVL